MPKAMKNLVLACGLATLLWTTAAGANEACIEKIMDKCTGCHYQTRICEKVGKKSRRAWKVTIKRMLRYGMQLNGAEQEQMLDCLQGLEKDSGTLCK